MKFLIKLIVWIAIFLVVLAIRFPYQPLFLELMDRIQETTNAQITWEEAEANILGAKLKGLEVLMPSGFSFKADTATIRPSLSGLTVACKQTTIDGKANAQLTSKGLEFSADKLSVNTGSNELGEVTMSGDLLYGLNGTDLSGELHLNIPTLSGALPMPLKDLEIGAKLSSDGGKESSSKVSRLNTTVNLYSNDGIEGSGNVTLTYTEGKASPGLSGNLNVRTKAFGTHNITLGGTWAQPDFKLAGAKK